MRAARARLGLTEGQLYTVGILTAVAALLLSSLTGLHGRIADFVAAELPLPPAAAESAVTVTTPTTAPSVPARTAPGFGTQTTARPAPVADGPTPTPTPTTTRPSAPRNRDERPEQERAPCPADAAVDASREVLVTIDALLGGRAPDGTLVSAIALVTGCSQADPAVLLLAGLIEIGQGLPDLGLGFLELPVLPFLEIPAPIVDLVQPARPALDPICNALGIPVIITSQAGPHYPPPIDAVFVVSLFYALATCGQLTAP